MGAQVDAARISLSVGAGLGQEKWVSMCTGNENGTRKQD